MPWEKRVLSWQEAKVMRATVRLKGGESLSTLQVLSGWRGMHELGQRASRLLTFA
jgi:hypothetical protein